MADRPHHIPIPSAIGLRSALKHPQTPASSSSNLATDGTTSPSSLTPGASPFLSPSVVNTGYLPKVSFDTFENPAAPMFSYTLQVKSEGYKRNRATRVFLCAASSDESGMEALDWVMESLVQDGDELVVFRGVDTEDLDKDHDAIREEAREVLRLVQQKNIDYEPDRKLSIIIEFIAGKVTYTIDRLIALYRPDSLVVGTRGQRSVSQKMLDAAFGGMGSVSKYCLSHSPVPVIVVRPERKVLKNKMKRRLNPKRGIHFEDAPSPSIGPIVQSPGTMSPALTPSSTRVG